MLSYCLSSPVQSSVIYCFLSRFAGARFSMNKHRSALRGTPGSACPQPEPNAIELPSCAPISARDAQRRLRRRWWRGDEGARRPDPEAQVLRHVMWHVLRNCAASLACSSFTCRLGKAQGAVELGAFHDEDLYASVLRATGGLVLPMRGSSAAHDKAEDHKSERAFAREQQFGYAFKRTAYSKC